MRSGIGGGLLHLHLGEERGGVGGDHFICTSMRRG